MTSGLTSAPADGGRYKFSTSGWATEKWVVAIALICLAYLIAIRFGFREINVLGVRIGAS